MEHEKYFICYQSYITDLKLKGNELIVYSIINGYSINGDDCRYSIDSFCKWLNVTRPTVIATLKSLEDKHLIEKIGKSEKGCNRYRGLNNFTPTSKETLPNNIYNNINDNTIKYSDDAVKITTLLFNEIQKRNPRFNRTTKQLDKWSEDFEKLHKNYSWEDIEKCVLFSQTNDFWNKFILSSDKIIKHFDKLFMQSCSAKSNNGLAACDQLTVEQRQEEIKF